VITGGIVLVGYIICFIFFAGGAATGTEEAKTAAAGLGLLVLLVFYAVAFAFAIYNQIFIVVKSNGQTIGKKMMNIRIVKEDGTPIGYGDAILRNIIGYIISGALCYLGFIWALFDARKQGFHDKIFKTLVLAA